MFCKCKSYVDRNKTYSTESQLKSDLITKMHAPVKRATNEKHVGAEKCAVFSSVYNSHVNIVAA